MQKKIIPENLIPSIDVDPAFGTCRQASEAMINGEVNLILKRENDNIRFIIEREVAQKELVELYPDYYKQFEQLGKFFVYNIDKNIIKNLYKNKQLFTLIECVKILAKQSESLRDLLLMWEEENDLNNKEEIIKSIQDEVNEELLCRLRKEITT